MILSNLLNSKKTLIMGILNVTPDSFYDGGRYNFIDNALKHAEEMIEQGADIIDIGGESTRPGAETVEETTEINRVIPVIQKIAKQNKDITISVDTYKSGVAEAAIDAGATIVNDISGMNFDPAMAKMTAKQAAYIIIMHIKGTPKNMQINPEYENVVDEIKDFLIKRIKYAVVSGIGKEKIIIDPGIGFGKTTEHNLEILRKLRNFRELGQPIVLGTSRKSFIGKILGSEKNPVPAEERLSGSLATCAWAISNGVKILRVHDVKETKQFLAVLETIAEKKGEKVPA